jgi:hypothetical protein
VERRRAGSSPASTTSSSALYGPPSCIQLRPGVERRRAGSSPASSLRQLHHLHSEGSRPVSGSGSIVGRRPASGSGCTSRGRKYPFYPLISDVFTFPKHLHRFLRGEARLVPVWPHLESRQGAVLGRSARHKGASKWRQTLQTCGGDLEGHTQIFWTESEAFCLLRTWPLTPE